MPCTLSRRGARPSPLAAVTLDLQSLLGQLDGEGEPGSEVSALQSQFSSLLESSGNSSSGVTLKDLLSAFASKIPSDAPDRKGYMVDTQA